MVTMTIINPPPWPTINKNGTAGNDLITGHNGYDGISTFIGEDTVFAGGGDDVIYGGGGSDLLDGGKGNDLVHAEWLGFGLDANSSDVLFGRSGDDTLVGIGGGDFLYGGGGNDRVTSGTINATDAVTFLSGGRGDDLIYGGDAREKHWGGAGNDTMIGTAGHDLMKGGAGADTFLFYVNLDRTVIRDFDGVEGDRLQLSPSYWQKLGDLSPEQVVEQFGAINPSGHAVLNFNQRGSIVFRNIDDPADLIAFIDIAVPNFDEF